MMGGKRARGGQGLVIAGALATAVLVLAGLWLLFTHCPWFWVVVNGMLQSQAGH